MRTVLWLLGNTVALGLLTGLLHRSLLHHINTSGSGVLLAGALPRPPWYNGGDTGTRKG